jgi:hypothetical protein
MPARLQVAVGEAGGFNAVRKLLTTSLQRPSRVEGVTDIEAALSAWEAT